MRATPRGQASFFCYSLSIAPNSQIAPAGILNSVDDHTHQRALGRHKPRSTLASWAGAGGASRVSESAGISQIASTLLNLHCRSQPNWKPHRLWLCGQTVTIYMERTITPLPTATTEHHVSTGADDINGLPLHGQKSISATKGQWSETARRGSGYIGSFAPKERPYCSMETLYTARTAGARLSDTRT